MQITEIEANRKSDMIRYALKCTTKYVQFIVRNHGRKFIRTWDDFPIGDNRAIRLLVDESWQALECSQKRHENRLKKRRVWWLAYSKGRKYFTMVFTYKKAVTFDQIIYHLPTGSKPLMWTASGVKPIYI